MQSARQRQIPLEPGQRYHIYNRGNNYQQVYREEKDYESFLNKWREFISPVAKTFAYSLLPNHFHAAVEIREQPLKKVLTAADLITDKIGTPAWIARAFTNFFISFARTLQNRHGHHGAVFHRSFNRIIVADDLQLDYLIAYIHFNRFKHGLFKGPLHLDNHCSFPVLIGQSATFLERDFLLDYFGGLYKFIAYHDLMAPGFELRDDLES